MGKGARARAQRAGKKEEMKRYAQKLKRRQTIRRIAGICVAALVVLAIIGGFVYNAVAATGYFLRNAVVMSSDNFKVDNAMMAYYVKNEYYSFANQYSDYLSMYGLDTSKSLKEQSYGESTWFDYFLGQAKSQVNDLLLCAEQAKADGMELDEEDKQQIEDAITSLKTYADSSNLTLSQYLDKAFVKGMNESDVRRALELSILGSKYSSSYVDALTYSDADLQGYFDSNKSRFIKADYLKYTFSGTPDADADDAAKAAAKEEVKAQAEALAANTTVDKFTRAMKDAMTAKEEAERAELAESENESALPENTVEEAVQEKLDNASGTMNYPEDDSEDAVAKWFFEDGRNVGDTYVSAPADDAATYEYTVYIVTKPAYFDDYATVNARHILLSDSTYESVEKAGEKAAELLAQYTAGEQTEEAFIELAKANSEDTTVQDNGGLYENITNDAASYPQSFVDWCYDAARQPGDVGVVTTDTGAHVLYYVGAGDTAWKVSARSSKKSEDWEAQLTALGEAYTVTTKDKKMQNIDL